jgi:molybdenum cofactor synthesis domain-containing protein
MPEVKTVTACAIIIGDEVLSGRTQDVNLSFLGENLGAIGIRLAEARVIADDSEIIQAAVNECRAAHDYVFTTGGIGPTHDDITSASIAAAFGLPLIRNPEAVALLKRNYKPEDVNDARMKMAETPEGATLLLNPISWAPGFQVENVFVMAGVPSVMRAMFDGFRDRLAGGEPMRSRTLAAHLKEGDIAAPLSDLQARYPNVAMGSYPFFRDSKLGASIVLRSTDDDALDAAVEELREIMRALGDEPTEET